MTDFAQKVADQFTEEFHCEFYDPNVTAKDRLVSIIRRLLAEHASPDLDKLAREIALAAECDEIAVRSALAPYFAARDERAAASIDGVVVFMRSESEGGDRCICCDGPHIFNRRLVLDPWESRLPKHMQTSVNDWLYDAVLFDNANEGARVRVTVEILALLPKEASDED